METNTHPRTVSLHDYAERFSARLQSFDRYRSRMYLRGFQHGLAAAVVGIAFFAAYFYVGGAK